MSQELNCMHRITIDIKTSIELMNHPVMKQLMADMVAQVESLCDGSYDSAVGLDTNYVIERTDISPTDTTKYLDNTLTEKLYQALKDAEVDSDILEDLSYDSELIDLCEQLFCGDDELLIEALGQVATHQMLTEK